MLIRKKVACIGVYTSTIFLMKKNEQPHIRPHKINKNQSSDFGGLVVCIFSANVLPCSMKNGGVVMPRRFFNKLLNFLQIWQLRHDRFL